MNYWLLAHRPYADQLNFWQLHHTWIIYSGSLDERLKLGDIVYIFGGDLGIYAWGIVSQKYQEPGEQTSLTIARGALQYSFIPLEQINQTKELAGLFNFPKGNTTFLTSSQVKVINYLLPFNCKPDPPYKKHFVYNQPAKRDEDLHTEYKDVKPKNIPNEAYEFAVAFLNKEGGSIYFGIDDSNKTVTGINLTYAQKDEIKKSLENKLSHLEPAPSAYVDYSMEFHNVIDEEGNEFNDLYVFELEVKRGSEIHKTQGGKIYEKNYSGRRKLE